MTPCGPRTVQSARPAWRPAGTLSAAEYRACLDALWAWLADGGEPPSCATADHADGAEAAAEAAAESDDAPRLAFVAADGVAALWYARRAVDDPDAAVHPARRVAAAVDSLVEELLGPRPVPAPPATVSEDRRLWVERQEAIAAHELARLAHAAMRDADQRTNRFRQRTRAAAKAGKPGLRQYDLRHYLDSVLVGEGMSYAKVGMVLGDSEKVVEATYAHPRRGDVAEARAAGSRGVAAEAAAASADGGRSAALEARRVAGVGDAEPA